MTTIIKLFTYRPEVTALPGIFTARNEVIFSQASEILSTGGCLLLGGLLGPRGSAPGGCLGPRGVCSQGAWSRGDACSGGCMLDPPGLPLLRAIRILLESILFYITLHYWGHYFNGGVVLVDYIEHLEVLRS